MNTDTSLSCNIVLLPADDLAQKSLDASQKLQKYDPLFVLGEQTLIPHCSLYMVQLKQADLDKISALLAQIAQTTSIQDLQPTGYVQDAGYIDVSYDCPDSLVALQNKVLEAINPLRDGLRPKDAARLEAASGIVRENLETYGYRGVGELFRPHITFTRVAGTEPVDLSDLPAPQAFARKFTKLALCEMGDNGTCARTIATFDLVA